MPRPIEYENLIKTRALEPVQPTPGAVAGFLNNADNFLALSKALMADTPLISGCYNHSGVPFSTQRRSNSFRT